MLGIYCSLTTPLTATHTHDNTFNNTKKMFLQNF